MSPDLCYRIDLMDNGKGIARSRIMTWQVG